MAGAPEPKRRGLGRWIERDAVEIVGPPSDRVAGPDSDVLGEELYDLGVGIGGDHFRGAGLNLENVGAIGGRAGGQPHSYQPSALGLLSGAFNPGQQLVGLFFSLGVDISLGRDGPRGHDFNPAEHGARMDQASELESPRGVECQGDSIVRGRARGTLGCFRENS